MRMKTLFPLLAIISSAVLTSRAQVEQSGAAPPIAVTSSGAVAHQTVRVMNRMRPAKNLQ
jgi:hypothetical protein